MRPRLHGPRAARHGGLRRNSTGIGLAVSPERLEPRRLLSAGDPDPSFGTGGRVVLENNGGASDVAVQGDGKVVVVGAGSDPFGPTGFLVHRLNRDGSPDTTFGQGGRVLTDFGATFETPTAVAIQPDGRIVVAGNASTSGFPSPTMTVAVARYLPDGSLDATFGSGGKAILTPHARPTVTDIALAPDGKIVLAGSAEPQQNVRDPMLVRLTAAGAADTSFSGDGVVVEGTSGVDDFLTGVATDAAGRAVTAMTNRAGDATTFSRYTGSGAVDTTFGTSGRTRLNWAAGGAVKVDPSGNVLAAYNDYSTWQAHLVRLTPAGAIDTTFGMRGVARAGEFGNPNRYGTDLALQYDGKIVVVGGLARSWDGTPGRMGAARLNPDGTYDVFFGDGGTAIVPRQPNEADEWGNAVAVSDDGGIYLAGKVGDIEGGDMSVVRLEGGEVTVPFTLDANNRYLTMTGTPFNDTVSLTRDVNNQTITATINGRTRTFAERDVTGVRVDTGEGADRLEQGSWFNADVYFEAGAGDDAATLHGTDAADFILLRDDRMGVSGFRTLYLDGVDAVTVRALGGNDTVTARDFHARGDADYARVTLDGGDGSDTIEGNRFTDGDVLLGGAGNDTIRAIDGQGDTVDGGGGTDSAGWDTVDTVTGVENPLNSSIRGAVFVDIDGDGSPDSYERIAFGFTVYLDADNDSVLDSGERRVVTNGGSSDGNYLFDYLPAGTYVVRVIRPTGGGWAATSPSGESRSVTLSSRQEATGRHFGYRQSNPTASISGTVFHDRDGDGVMEAGEAGLGGRTVWADHDNDGVRDSSEPSAVTDAAGLYRFTNLQSGYYRLRQVLPSGWRQTAGNSFLEVRPDEVHNAVNFGASDKAGILGTVFHDWDADGEKDYDDHGLAGATAYVDANNNGRLDAGELSAAVGANGAYVLAPLEPGTYAVRVASPADRPFSQSAPAGGAGYTVTVGRAEAAAGRDFAMYIPVWIEGQVGNDPDGDGWPNSAGLAGFTVYRDVDFDGAFDPGEPSRVTDGDGNYSFTDLVPGSIVLRVVPPAGWEATRSYGQEWPSGGGTRPVPLGVRRVAGVVGRHVFYDNSALDGYGRGPDALAASAIATDKRALLPGQAATFANVTSYAGGVNGILIDLPTTLALLDRGDFEFRMTGPGGAGGWVPAPTPEFLHQVPLPGTGLDRVVMTWHDGVVRNGWLQVRVLANTKTRLTAADVFYFGNLVGETGDAPAGATALTVTARDLTGVRSNLMSAALAGNRFDFNRNGRVDVVDYALARRAYATRRTLQLITG